MPGYEAGEHNRQQEAHAELVQVPEDTRDLAELVRERKLRTTEEQEAHRKRLEAANAATKELKEDTEKAKKKAKKEKIRKTREANGTSRITNVHLS